MAGSSKSSEIGSSRGRVTNWTDEEDKILSRLLKEEFLSGGTTGNTFTKPALLRILERFNMEVKTNYSIHNMQNRMKNLRKLFRRYHYLATLSSWGWDPERQIPANTDEQWNSVISVNKELIHCRNKPFAPYEDMLIWYGKQVATGEGAATHIDYTSQQAIPALQSSEVPISWLGGWAETRCQMTSPRNHLQWQSKWKLRLMIQLLLLVMDKHLSILAKQHLETRFLKIHAEKSPFLTEKLRIVVLPTLALVKNAKVEDYVVGFDELGGTDEFSTEELEERLAKSQVIIFEGEASSRLIKPSTTKRSVRQSETSNLSDSD